MDIEQLEKREQQKLRNFFDECMNILAAAIEPFIRCQMGANMPLVESASPDARELMTIMRKNWKDFFSASLKRRHRGFVDVLLDLASSQWAHKIHPFSLGDMSLSLEIARRMMVAVGAGEKVAQIDKLEKDYLKFVNDITGSHKKAATSGGVIVINRSHTAADLAGKKVRCPFCNNFPPFKTWPGGWDSHAEERCSGLASFPKKERKKEFLRRYGYLMKRHAGRYPRPSDS